MKNIYKLLSILTITFGVISCDEFVDYEASETYTIVADDYFKTSSDYEAALVGVYDVSQWTLYNVMIGEIASDNSLCGFPCIIFKRLFLFLKYFFISLTFFFASVTNDLSCLKFTDTTPSLVLFFFNKVKCLSTILAPYNIAAKLKLLPLTSGDE